VDVWQADFLVGLRHDFHAVQPHEPGGSKHPPEVDALQVVEPLGVLRHPLEAVAKEDLTVLLRHASQLGVRHGLHGTAGQRCTQKKDGERFAAAYQTHDHARD
jgi:hypothetical protein